MDIITRLNEFVNRQKLSSSQFADLLGIPRPSMSQILSGRNKKISNEFLGKLHHAFPNLDLMWLMFGEENADVSTDIKDTSSEQTSYAAPSLFDTADRTPYHSDDAFATDNNGVCESAIDDLKNTSAYIHEVNAPNINSPEISSSNTSSRSEKRNADSATNVSIRSNINTASVLSTIQTSNRIKSIIVYYADKTFEVFKPE